MKTKHTPGPWRWKDELVLAGGDPDTRRGSVIVENCGCFHFEVDPEQEANANLIAAAPDLLEACQTFELWLSREEAGLPGGILRDTYEGEAAWREWYDENLRLCDLAQRQARAAIAKANGTTL